MPNKPSENSVSVITEGALSSEHRRQLTALRRPVLDASAKFAIVRERLTDLAPKVMRLYAAISAETERFTFVDFARLFDASIPTHAADRDGAIGYRNSKVYYTLTYMRRLVQTARTGRRGQQGVRDSATDALARTLATVLQVVSDPNAVWTAIQSEFGFTERLMTRLRKRVEATKPLIKLSAAKPAKVGDVIHMEPIAKPAEETAPAAGARMSLEPRRAGRRRAA